MYLHFPDLDPKFTGRLEKLQIGHCYMPGLDVGAGRLQRSPSSLSGGKGSYPGSEIVRALRVRNVSDRKIYLTCTPNLKKQCFVYAEIPAEQTTISILRENESTLLAEDGADGNDADRGESMGRTWATAPARAISRPQVVDLPLLPQSETTLYIGLRPVLPNEAYTSG